MDDNKIIVYGASDDLIEVEGSVGEEFNPTDGTTSFLGFSNGVVLKVTYDDEGIWRIQPRAGHHLVNIDFALGEDADRRPDGKPGHSDIATFEGPVSWVVFGDRLEMS